MEISKEEIIEKILSKSAFEIFQSKMLNTFIYYVNDKEFNRIKNHIFTRHQSDGVKIIDGEVVIVKTEEQEYDTIIIDCYIFKKVSREQKLERITHE